MMIKIQQTVEKVVQHQYNVLNGGWAAIFLIFTGLAHSMNKNVITSSFSVFRDVFNEKMALWMPFALMEAITACVAFSYSLKCQTKALKIPPTLSCCVDACSLIGVIGEVMSGSTDVSSHPVISHTNSTQLLLSKNIYIPAPVSASTSASSFNSRELPSPDNEMNLDFGFVQQRAMFLSSQVQLSAYKSISFFRYLWVPLLIGIVSLSQGQLDTAVATEAMFFFFFLYQFYNIVCVVVSCLLLPRCATKAWRSCASSLSTSGTVSPQMSGGLFESLCVSQC
jgi:hypothetical protein